MADLFLSNKVFEEEEKKEKTTKLTDVEKSAILEALKNSPCLWNSGESWAKKDKQEAVEGICTKFGLTSDGFKKLLHSLRTSMVQEVKRTKEQEHYESKWKFYKHMKFLEGEIVKSLEQELEWTDEDTMTVIEFYHTNPVLWNHCLSEYKDCNLKKLAMEKLTATLSRTEDEIKNHWHSLKTVFDREDKRQKSSKKSGTSTSEVYKSNWKYFDCLTFVRDCAEVDVSQSTLSIGEGSLQQNQPPYKVKRKETAKAQTEMQSVRLELYKNAVEFFKKPETDVSVEKLTEEEAFGKSVGQTLTRFNPRQRAIAKKKISDVLFDVEMGNLGSMQQSPILTENSSVFPMNSLISAAQRYLF